LEPVLGVGNELASACGDEVGRELDMHFSSEAGRAI
jgi:hypothetical protein